MAMCGPDACARCALGSASAPRAVCARVSASSLVQPSPNLNRGPARQCLDDSTDPETRAVVDKGITFWRAQGVKIEAIRRTNRQASSLLRHALRHACAPAAAAAASAQCTQETGGTAVRRRTRAVRHGA
eukprot:2962767-Prymnesium_polylepis.1